MVGPRRAKHNFKDFGFGNIYSLHISWIASGNRYFNFVLKIVDEKLIKIMSICLGIAHYEKYGGDMQKRQLKNQLMSYGGLLTMLGLIIHGGILILRTFCGPIGSTLAITALITQEVAGLALPLNLTQILAFHILKWFNWRLVAGVNEDSMATFLPISSFLFGVTGGIIALELGLYYDERYFLLSGTPDSAKIIFRWCSWPILGCASVVYQVSIL